MALHRLYAEREGERTEIVKCWTKAEATFFVEELEYDGTWPEGHDAVLVCPNGGGREYVFTDQWDPL